MLGIPYLTKKVAITAAVLLAAGGTAAAAVIPAVAAQPSTTAPSPAPTAPNHSDGKHHGMHRHPILRGLIAATAKETGLSVETVVKDLHGGQTLNSIAGSKASAVENDVLSAIQQRLDRAVDHGRITKDKEADLLAKAKARIEKLMSVDLSKAASAAPV